MPAVIPAPVVDVQQRYEALSVDDQRLLDAIIAAKKQEAAEGEVPWPMEELTRRIALHEAGEGRLYTIDEMREALNVRFSKK